MNITSSTPLWKVLMHRDGMTEENALLECRDCRADLEERLEEGDMPFEILAEWFGLEPDWNIDLATNPLYTRHL